MKTKCYDNRNAESPRFNGRPPPFRALVLVEIEPLVRLILILVRETALPGPPRRSTSPWAQRATRHAG
jgi:hypothetical protein